MKLISLLLFALLTISCSRKPEERDWIKERERIQQYRDILAKDGLYSFCTNTTHHVPHIHSDAWVERTLENQNERQAYEYEKRAFGLDSLLMLENYALSLLQTTTTDVREIQANELLSISEYFKQKSGYGNFILKKYSEDLACIPIGHLICDLTYSTNQINLLINRISEKNKNIATRIEILNEESPHKYYFFGSSNDRINSVNLEKQWGKHAQKAYDYFKSIQKWRPRQFIDTQGMPYEYAFYSEDAGPGELSSRWARKMHLIVCLRGFEWGGRTQILDLLRFRNLIGYFPQKPKNPLVTQFGTDVHKAFLEAWKPLRMQYGRNCGARIYVQLQNNDFMDWSTRALLDSMKNKTHDNKGETLISKE